MSMPVITMSDNPVSLDAAVANLLQSIALEETALSHILNAEGEKIQRVIAMNCATVEQILNVNDSVMATISTVAQLEDSLKGKLETIINNMCCCLGDNSCNNCDGDCGGDDCDCDCDCNCDCEENCCDDDGNDDDADENTCGCSRGL